MGNKLIICPNCGGDGKETCHNPDHGFIGRMGFHDIGRLGCPVCGHDEEHKTMYYRNGKWEQDKCDTCNGNGHVAESVAIEFMDSMNYDFELSEYKHESEVTNG